MRVSANLGFLWADRPLPDAIRAARAAGFDAVEFHWPYEADPRALRAVLAETGLPALGLNTRRGNPGEMGLAALPGREAEARGAIDEAIAYARITGTEAIHVMAGTLPPGGDRDAARATFVGNLIHACDAAPEHTIRIEPLNAYDAPGYFLDSTQRAAAVIQRVGRPNLRLMFDCYHVQIAEGDLTRRLRALLPLIGHVQFAAVPDRGPPDAGLGGGEVNYAHLFRTLRALGWSRPLGAEYRPAGAEEAALDWLDAARAI
jgi:hydroxypyruvate isomerase